MHRTLAAVLALLVVNDVLLVVLLEASVEPWGVVLLVALALTVPVLAVASWAGDDGSPPSRADLDEQLRAARADLTRLEERVGELEDRERDDDREDRERDDDRED